MPIPQEFYDMMVYLIYLQTAVSVQSAQSAQSVQSAIIVGVFVAAICPVPDEYHRNYNFHLNIP